MSCGRTDPQEERRAVLLSLIDGGVKELLRAPVQNIGEIIFRVVVSVLHCSVVVLHCVVVVPRVAMQSKEVTPARGLMPRKQYKL